MSKKTKKKQPGIHIPEEIRAIMSPEEISSLRKRVNRRIGSCGVCHKKLGRTKELAFVITGQQITDLATLAGRWHVMTTHRDCQKEEVLDSSTNFPQSTYATTLVALPVEQTYEGLPRQVPALMINPSVDHFMLTKDRDGSFRDSTLELLEDEAGFGRMTKTEPKGPDTLKLQAYVNGADVTAALNDHGLSWSHEQPATNAESLAALSGNLKTLVEAWDNTLLIMISPKFKSWDPAKIFTELSQLLSAGEVLAAPAQVEFRETTVDLVSKAFAAASGTSANG